MFEVFEHTADLGLRVRAADLDTLFREAAEGFFSLVVERWTPQGAVREFRFEIEAERHDAELRLGQDPDPGDPPELVGGPLAEVELLVEGPAEGSGAVHLER